ncbi:probable arabinan endo-1,5-alpha-L-arabinosidase C [Aspergillus lentulus]|nr:probable arabinan endo-1,5-alpha-L-arabinosidase C [Aspergillus lentulus]GFG09765.1 probable arabinan endo-1,5-alpha-L-arabinosidase C [Aspergillus lentulus]
MYLYTLILLFLASVNVNAYADPGACSGNCWTHDPGLYQRKSDGKYFRFATGGGIHIASADNLEGPWTDDGYVLPNGSIIDLDGKTNLWAPDLHYRDGTYYLYYAVSSLGSQNSAIGVATSKTMEAGSWTDHGTTGIESTSASPYNTIDANWIVVGDTQCVNFGSYWNNLFQVEMANGLKMKSGATPHQISYNASGIHRQEAAFMFERNNYFYLTFSGGIALGYNDTWPAPGEEYFISVCRSTSATGGFVDKNGVSCLNSGGTLLLASHDFVYGPGGQGILKDSNKGLVLYYHYADTRIGKAVEDYQFGWNQLKWDNDWPSV